MLLSPLNILLIVSPALALTVPFLQATETSEEIRGFSVEVPSRSSAKRDFVKEWSAARLKYGGSVPEGLHSSFQLGDAGKPLFSERPSIFLLFHTIA